MLCQRTDPPHNSKEYVSVKEAFHSRYSLWFLSGLFCLYKVVVDTNSLKSLVHIGNLLFETFVFLDFSS